MYKVYVSIDWLFLTLWKNKPRSITDQDFGSKLKIKMEIHILSYIRFSGDKKERDFSFPFLILLIVF